MSRIVRRLFLSCFALALLLSGLTACNSSAIGADAVNDWLLAGTQGPGDSVGLALLDQGSTDDDTYVEWLDLHFLETNGLSPAYERIRAEWVDHLYGEVCVATRAARDRMDDGVFPPTTRTVKPAASRARVGYHSSLLTHSRSAKATGSS